MASSDVSPRRPTRWWLAAIILLLAVAVRSCLPLLRLRTRQDENLATLAIVAVTFLMLWGWLLLFAGLSRTQCWRVFVGTIGWGLLSALLFEVRGVSGDMMPILGWRWSNSGSSAPALVSDEAALSPDEIIATSVRSPSITDFSQILGVDRNGRVHQLKLDMDWDRNPPELLWQQPIGPGWSGFAVVGNLAVTMEQRDEDELVTCYDLSSGKPVWQHADRTRYSTTIAGEGPRSVPTIAEGRVCSLGATGRLNCLDLATGDLHWTTNVISANGSAVPDWGVSGSPLVVDGMAVVSTGGSNQNSLIAHDLETGAPVWGAGEGSLQYSSPVLCTIHDERQILIFNREGVVAHRVDTGEVRWQHPWPPGHPHVTMPVVLPNDQVLISSGYGVGAQLVQVLLSDDGQWSTKMLWKSKRLKSKFANMIVHDGFVYGLDDGILVCLEVSSGSLQWKRGRYGHGQLLLVGDAMLVMTEKGKIVLLDPNPKEHRKLAEYSVLAGKTWNPPAIAGHFLLVRNDRFAACYRLPLQLGRKAEE